MVGKPIRELIRRLASITVPPRRTSPIETGAQPAVDKANPHRVFLEKNVCSVPFVRLHIGPNGDVFPCCTSQMKRPLVAGNILRDSLDEIWNSEVLQNFREGIYQQKYHLLCAEHCIPYNTLIHRRGVMYGNLISERLAEEVLEERTRLSAPYAAITVPGEDACNLACISCRPKRVLKGSQLSKDVSKRAYEELRNNISKVRMLRLLGSAELFFQKTALDFLRSLKGEDLRHLSLSISTNANLLNEARFDMLDALRVGFLSINVSIDAATKDTYEEIRRFGKWARLMRNMSMLAQKKAEGRINALQVSFVVMKRNVDELPAFVKLAKGWHCNQVVFQRINASGVARPQNFFLERDPFYMDKLAEALRDPVMNDPIVNKSSLL